MRIGLSVRTTVLAMWLPAVSVLAVDAAAQTLPGPAQPGQAERAVRDQPLVPRRTADGVPLPGEAATVFPDTAVAFTLKAVVIEGSSLYDAAALRPLYAEFIDRTIPVTTVFAIAERATAFYRSNGYILSQVVVPPQEIDGGTVRLQVVEGFVDKVIVEGEDGSWRDLVQRMTDKITRSRPLHSSVLERYLLLAGDLAGLTVRGVLSPSEATPGAATLTVRSELDRFDAAFQIANYGSDFVGPVLAAGGLTGNSLLGQHERVGVRVQTATQTSELLFTEIFAAVPVGTEGTNVYGRFSNSDSDPGNGLERFDIANDSLHAAAGIRHPLIRSRRRNLFIDGQFEWIELESKSTVFGDLSDDRLRVVRVGADFDFVDAWFGGAMPALTTISVRLSQGLDLLDATDSGDPLASRPNAGATFTALRGEVQRYQRLPLEGVTVLVAARGQYAARPLLAGEEIGFGGLDYLRGYDPSTLLGDRGIAGKLELQVERAFGPAVPAIDRAQLYGFLDSGVVENIDFNGPGNNRTTTLHSTGGGVRIGLGGRFELDLGVAVRLNRSTSVTRFGGDRWRAMARLTGTF